MSPTHLLSDLAATFRLAARFGRRESAGNHFCAAVSEDGAGFLMNPKWSHFSAIRASDLPLLDTHDDTTLARPDAPDTTARCLHGATHRVVPAARVLLHAIRRARPHSHA